MGHKPMEEMTMMYSPLNTMEALLQKIRSGEFPSRKIVLCTQSDSYKPRIKEAGFRAMFTAPGMPGSVNIIVQDSSDNRYNHHVALGDTEIEVKVAELVTKLKEHLPDWECLHMHDDAQAIRV